MYSALDIATSGLVAQRTRLTAISANVANAHTLKNDHGEYDPYRRRVVEFAAGDIEAGEPLGVRVAGIHEDPSDLRPRYEPGSPYADEQGMVYYPNVNSVVEQMNAMEASRAYEAGISVIEATKSMMTMALEMLTP